MLGNGVTDNHSNNKDSKHWLASRLLIKTLLPDGEIVLLKDQFNKPHLLVNGVEHFISITHSHDFAAVIISEVKKVSLDMEQIDQRINRVGHKFTREDELAYLNADHLTGMQTILWSAKETLYKYYGLKELDFKEHLLIAPFIWQTSPMEITGHIHKNGLHIELTIHVEAVENYVLTYSC